MTEPVRLWMRHEVRSTEHRAPIVPADAGRLVDRGVEVTVEDSAHRAFALADYAAAGCRIEPAGSWVTAPDDQYVIGLKELPDFPAALPQRHVFFGHAYRGQVGGRELLRRFVAGGGALLDLEHLVDGEGRRLAAFGYWAGYAGAALAVLRWRGRLAGPLRPLSKESLDGALRATRGGEAPSVLVVGALGRCGRGARDALAVAGIAPTSWDVAETRVLDRTALLDHDILVNTVGTTAPDRPFLTSADLDDPPRRLTLVSDVTCDLASDCNALPIYDRTTTWRQPVRRLRDGPPPLDVIAIDNLPSLLPREASVGFSADLLPHLMTLGEAEPTWQRCLRAFRQACRSAGFETEPVDA